MYMYINVYSDIIVQIMGERRLNIKHLKSNIVFLVRFGVSVVELD